jgi:hypothetical protein
VSALRHAWWMQSNRGSRQSEIVPSLGLFTGGSNLAYATVGGTQNNLNPGGTWPSLLIGQIDVTTTAGSEIWAGLVAVATQGYAVLVTIVADGGTGNTLTLENSAAGQTAGNQLFGSGNLVLSVGQASILIYNTTLNQWLFR